MSVSSPKETKSPEADMVSVSGGFFVEGKLPTVKDSRKTIKWNVLIGFPRQADKLEFDVIIIRRAGS